MYRVKGSQRTVDLVTQTEDLCHYFLLTVLGGGESGDLLEELVHCFLQDGAELVAYSGEVDEEHRACHHSSLL